MSCPASVHRARACYYLSPTSVSLSPVPVRRASSVSRNFQPRPTPATSTSASVSSNRQSFKNWSQVNTAKDSTLPPSAISRLSSVLNLELPQKFWQHSVKIVASTFDRAKSPDEPKEPVVKEVKVKQRVHAIHLREDPYHRESPPMKLDPKTTTAVQVVEPELHDFATAMTQMNNSVTDYLYGSKKSPSTVHKPFSKPPAAIKKEMQQSFSQQLYKLIPSSLYRSSPKVVEKTIPNTVKLCKRTIDQHTKGLVITLRKSKTDSSRLHRLQELCKHLEAYPDAKNLAVREKVLGALLKLRDVPDAAIRQQASEALTLVGWTDPVQGPGIRVLSLDGGGTRGLVCIEILKRLEATTGEPIHRQFDLICGVSTGALLALMLGVFRLPLSDAETIYKDFSRDMFNRHMFAGASGVLTSQAYYDTQLWENILKENVGWKSFFETAQDPETCKIACVSALVNLEKIQNFLFRNYTYAVGRASVYPGSMRKALWQAVRASSAAPGYYEEYQLGKYIHTDGGVLTNNPSAIALHECRLLWPGERVHCLVSMGNGRYEPTGEKLKPVQVGGVKNKINKFVQSATDTEAVHTVLNDLLPADSYFRFNPFMSQDFTLDETREERWAAMQHEARVYCRHNQYKIDKLAERLAMPRTAQQKTVDWLKMTRITMDS